MLLLMIEREPESIHSIVWFDTGWEFPEMIAHISDVERKIGSKIIRLFPHISFDVLLQKYGWPSWHRRWCTNYKIAAIKKYAKQHDTIECIGFSTDELKRVIGQVTRRPTRFPLIEWGISSKEALEICLSKGYAWGGLYDYRNRVSCYCCPLQRKSELQTVRQYHPKLWKGMQERGATLQRHPEFGSDKYTLADYEAKWSAQKNNMEAGLHPTTAQGVPAKEQASSR